ncbi:MAG: tRNA pseudouridine synthase B [uncultured bacterium]|nr:MAG: tRNA pseudouridine synthase B [uncultured bacterium]
MTAKLGVRTATGDNEGEIVETKSTVGIQLEKIQQVINQFIGDIQQIPPMFSALKHQGKPLYELARKGIEVVREPRAVKIFSLSIESFVNDELSLRVHCSKGTYIRTLVEDIGAQLGCGAHVIRLRRPKVSPYSEAFMHTLPELQKIAETAGLNNLDACLLPIETAVQTLPAVKLSTAAAFYIRTGQPVRMNFISDSLTLRLFSEDGRFLGVGEVMSDGRVKPQRLLSSLPSVDERGM